MNQVSISVIEYKQLILASERHTQLISEGNKLRMKEHMLKDALLRTNLKGNYHYVGTPIEQLIDLESINCGMSNVIDLLECGITKEDITRRIKDKKMQILKEQNNGK